MSSNRKRSHGISNILEWVENDKHEGGDEFYGDEAEGRGSNADGIFVIEKKC